MSTRTADATATELRAVVSAAARLLDRLDLTGADADTQRHLGALADDLDAVATHPTALMAGEVERHLDAVAPAVGMSVGDALASMARVGLLSPGFFVASTVADRTLAWGMDGVVWGDTIGQSDIDAILDEAGDAA